MAELGQTIRRLISRAGGGDDKPSQTTPDEKKNESVARVDRRVSESDARRSAAGPSEMSIVDMVTNSVARFLGDQRSFRGGRNGKDQEGEAVPGESASASSSGIRKAQIDRTQVAIMGTTAAMVERPFDIRFSPVSTREQWQYALKTKTAQKLALYLNDKNFAAIINPSANPEAGQLPGFDDKELAGMAFIDEARAEWMMETLRHPITGLPLLTEADFYVVNDISVARAAQRVHDNRWDEASSDDAIREHALYMAINGFQPIHGQWSVPRQRFELENVHALAIWPDPAHTRIETWNYHVLQHFLSLDEAIENYPQFERKLRESAREGSLQDTDWREPRAYTDITYEREMVEVRTLWEKNQVVPMWEFEAVQAGRVIPIEGNSEDTEYRLVRDENNKPVIEGPIVTPPTPSEPKGGDKWPTTFGIEQLQVLPQINEELDRRRCPYLMEPLGWTVNVPIMHTPWGIGEPHRLEDISRGINQNLTTLLVWMDKMAFPVEFWPADLLTKLRRKGYKGYTRPNQQIGIPRGDFNRIWSQAGKVSVFQHPPAPPTGLIMVLDRLLNEHDKLSGFVDALQGRAPSAQTSGRLFEQLRQEARGVLGYKSQNLESTVKRMVRLEFHAIVKWMWKSVWYEILDDYPPFVVDEIRRRLDVGRFNVTVEAAMGRGVTRELQREESRLLRQANLVDRQTVLEDHDRDPEPIKRRLVEEAQEQIEAASGGPAPLPTPVPGTAPMAGQPSQPNLAPSPRTAR